MTGTKAGHGAPQVHGRPADELRPWMLDGRVQYAIIMDAAQSAINGIPDRAERGCWMLGWDGGEYSEPTLLDTASGIDYAMWLEPDGSGYALVLAPDSDGSPSTSVAVSRAGEVRSAIARFIAEAG